MAPSTDPDRVARPSPRMATADRPVVRQLMATRTRAQLAGKRPRRVVRSCVATAAAFAAVVSGTPAIATSGAAPTPPVNSELPWNPAVTDASGGLLAWYRPQQGVGYDHVLRLGWNFLEHEIPDEPGTDLKTYLVNSVFNGTTRLGAYWQSNPAMVFGSFVDSSLAWYPYSGDETAVSTVRGMLDYLLAHGLTPARWSWSGVPFPTGCGNRRDYGQCLSDMPRSYYGGIEPDKVGEVGIGYALMYEETGDRAYLREAIRCANALAAHVRKGDDSHTPWPFRVDGRSGATLDGETLGGVVVSPLRLFDELIRIHKGNIKSYRRARRLAWGWLDSHQLNPHSPTYDQWTGYFEDVSKDQNDLNQAAPTYTALYLLNLPDPGAVDPQWRVQVNHLIAWVRQHFGIGPFDGAWGINEQGPAVGHYVCCSTAGLGSDTSRWAAVSALYYQKTGDSQAEQEAFRSLNYATYFEDSAGAVSCCGQSFGTIQYWFSDGYSDYLRSFNWAMAAIPSLAPVDESHLLGSTSVVQHVAYRHDRITYRTFDADATETLRLAFRPGSITAGGSTLHRKASIRGAGYTLEPLPGGGYAVRIHHVSSANVVITE
jgi:hypothetical protein